MEHDGKIRVLLVDDEEAFLSSSSAVLSRRGFVVDLARDGASALDKIDTAEYDAVVLDVKMPGMDGIDVLRRLRGAHPSIPVIMLTGHTSIIDAFQSAKVGISKYLSKPIDMNVLAEHIRRVVAESVEARGIEEEEKQPGEDIRAIRVLLIDDEVDFLGSMTKILRRRGMDVTAAASGEEALALLVDRPVDVAVLDLKMPGISGQETLKRIKANFEYVQVIILTGHPSVRSAMELIKLGANEYIEKPPVLEELVRAIRELHESRRRGILERQQKLIEEIRERYPD